MHAYTRGTNVTLSLMGDDEAVLRSAYETLSVGGTIQMPLEKQMWATSTAPSPTASASSGR